MRKYDVVCTGVRKFVHFIYIFGRITTSAFTCSELSPPPPINLGKTTKFVSNFTKLQLLTTSTLHSFDLKSLLYWVSVLDWPID